MTQTPVKNPNAPYTKTPTRKPKTLAELRADPRIKRVYRDSDGLWVDLDYGWKNTYDEPRGALHGIHENTLKDALDRWDGIAACDCDDCTAYEAQQKRESGEDRGSSREGFVKGMREVDTDTLTRWATHDGISALRREVAQQVLNERLVGWKPEDVTVGFKPVKKS